MEFAASFANVEFGQFAKSSIPSLNSAEVFALNTSNNSLISLSSSAQFLSYNSSLIRGSPPLI